MLSLAIRILLLALLVLVPLQPAHAQPSLPDLIVTLRDEQGQGISGILVTVRTAATTAPLATGLTNPDGTVTFATLLVPDVQVVVSGTVAGTPLTLAGADAEGIRVVLGAPPTILALRVDARGRVLPDPVTMITRDPAVTTLIGPTPDLHARPAAPPAPEEAVALLAPPVPTVQIAPTPVLSGTSAEPVGTSWSSFVVALLIGVVLVLIALGAWVSAAQARRSA